MLIADLLIQGWTVNRLRIAAESVKRRATYGTISLDHWVADDVITGDELIQERQRTQREIERAKQTINTEVARRIDERIIKAKQQLSETGKADDWKAAEMVAIDGEVAKWHKIREDFAVREQGRQKKQMLVYKKILREMPRETRVKLFQEAVTRGLLKSYDDTMIEHAHLFPDVLGPILRDWSKQSPDAKIVSPIP